MATTKTDVPALAQRVMEMKPHQRLVIAAGLIERGAALDIAEALARGVADELAAVRLLAK